MALEEWVLALTGSPLVLLALFAFCVVDGFFPPIPSESVVIALAALAMSTGEPNLWLVVAVSAVGAFAGDQIAYSIGQRIPLHRIRVLQGRRGRALVAHAERSLRERGAAYILAARYIPIGRVAVNMTAGAVRYPRTRFTGVAAVASVTWAGYSVVLGMSAGVWLQEHPWMAVLVGVAVGILLGLVIDAALRRFLGSRGGRDESVTESTVRTQT